jgi:hypothetical protein
MEPKRNRPWSLAAGALTSVLGVALLIWSGIGAGPPLKVSITALVLGAALELASGFELRREGGSWIAQVVSGASIFFLAAFLLGVPPLARDALSPPPVAMLLGIFCLVNAIFRGVDIWADKPRAAAVEALDVLLTLVLAVALLGFWRDVTARWVAIASSVELFGGGVAILGAAFAAWQHPELSAYDDLAAKLSGIPEQALEARVEGYRTVEEDRRARLAHLPTH